MNCVHGYKNCSMRKWLDFNCVLKYGIISNENEKFIYRERRGMVNENDSRWYDILKCYFVVNIVSPQSIYTRMLSVFRLDNIIELARHITSSRLRSLRKKDCQLLTHILWGQVLRLACPIKYWYNIFNFSMKKAIDYPFE